MKAASIAGNTSKVFLAGFSEGAQLTSYIQIAKLNFALGGTIVMDGFALPPLCDMPKYSPEHAKAVSSYYGNDMRWMIYQGGSDPIFPAKLTMDTYTTIFDKLGASSTLEIFHTEPGMSHTLIEKEFNQMIDFIGN